MSKPARPRSPKPSAPTGGQIPDPPWSDQRWERRRAARERFFTSVALYAPKVLEQLALMSFDHFMRVRDLVIVRRIVPRSAWGEIHWDDVADPGPHARREVDDLRNSLRQWSQRHHLEADWCLGMAVATLDRWARRAKNARELLKQGRLDWADATPSPTRETAWIGRPTVFSFALPHGWQPGVLARDTVEAYVRGELDAQVKEYFDRAEDEARERDLLAEQESQPTDEHLAWLVAYQIKGLTYDDIARTVGPDKEATTVRRPVVKAAAVIGLPLRKDDRETRSRRRAPQARVVKVNRRSWPAP